MEARLIKKDGNYFLWSHDWNPKTKEGIIANTYDKPSGEVLQLSLKNCQAIERGYDLDELGMEMYRQEKIANIHSFKAGFQKALELMGDKKFTAEEMELAFNEGADHRYTGSSIRFWESLPQQNEWRVEIVMDICGDKVYAVPEPKLDSNGCLILRRI